MADLVTAADLGVLLGETVDAARAEPLLNMAEALVVAEYGTATLPAAGTRARDLLRRVVLGVASRDYRNPEGIVQESVGSYSYTRPGAGLFLTAEERAAIAAARGLAGLPVSGVYSVPLTVAAHRQGYA